MLQRWHFSWCKKICLFAEDFNKHYIVVIIFVSDFDAKMIIPTNSETYHITISVKISQNDFFVPGSVFSIFIPVYQPDCSSHGILPFIAKTKCSNFSK